jgi:CMP-N,N'-diacetyllegionaminic acid synthase
MFRNKRILAVVPARGGSKGIPKKNIYPLLGRPLVAYVGDLIQHIPYIDRAIVSTDDNEIAEVAHNSGLDVPFYRPEDLSGDEIGDYEVLHHALIEVELLDNTRYDIIIMLQPTSPLRRACHVEAAVTRLIDGGWDAVWTVSKTNEKYHPLKQLNVEISGKMEYYDERGSKIIARQQLGCVYHRNGAAYALSRGCLLDQHTIKGRRTAAVIIDDPMISIDTLEDVRVAEELLRCHQHSE